MVLLLVQSIIFNRKPLNKTTALQFSRLILNRQTLLLFYEEIALVMGVRKAERDYTARHSFIFPTTKGKEEKERSFPSL
jgi:hypothetical protein